MISITHFDFTFFYDGSSKWSIKFVIQPYVILPIVYARYSIDTNDLHLYTRQYNIWELSYIKPYNYINQYVEERST